MRQSPSASRARQVRANIKKDFKRITTAVKKVVKK